MYKQLAGLTVASALAFAALFFAARNVTGLAASPAAALAGSSVQLRTNDEKDTTFCSATHIGGGRFITAWHCVNADEKIAVATEAGDKAGAEVLWSNKLYDLALVRATGLHLRRAEVDCRLVEPGTAVIAIGNPLGMEFIRTTGTVVSKLITGAVKVGGDMIWQERILSDVTIAPGSSGGGLFDLQGRLVGVNVGAYVGFRYALSVPSTTVCQLLGR